MDTPRLVKSVMERADRYKRPQHFPWNKEYIQSSIFNAGWVSPIERFESNGQIVERCYFKGKPYRRYPGSAKFSDKVYFRCSPTKDGGRQLALHQEVWVFFKSVVPKHGNIHHKDGTPANNNIENLKI